MLPRLLITASAALLILMPAPAASTAGQFPRGLLYGAVLGCTISALPITFGNYDPLSSSPLDGQGSVIYTCTLIPFGPTPNIRIELSSGGAGNFDRRMSFGFERLFYNLYLDATRSTVWGNGSGGTDYYSATPPNGVPVTVPIYGRIPARQDAVAGPYSDGLQARILF